MNKVETPIFLIFESGNMTEQRLARLKQKKLIPVAIDGDNYVFRVQAKYEYIVY